MSTVEASKITPVQFLAMPDRSRYELVDGQLVETNVSLLSTKVAGRIFRRLDEFCDLHPVGWAWPPETYVRCYPDPNKFRKPDACFVRLDRIPADWIDEAALEIAPDLVVEVVSPNDIAYDVRNKIREYLDAGVRLVWVVFPPTRSVSVYRADGTVSEVTMGSQLDGEDIIPGFRCTIADLFPPARPI